MTSGELSSPPDESIEILLVNQPHFLFELKIGGGSMNPWNNASLYGRVNDTPLFLKDGKGNEFAARMPLAVKRNFRNKNGEYMEDIITVKYLFDEGRSGFAHSIEPGDILQLSGTIRTESYNGKQSLIILTDSISFDEMTRRRKYSKKEGDRKVSAEFGLDLPLPF